MSIDIGQIISEIQSGTCAECTTGKCLRALLDLKNSEEPQSPSKPRADQSKVERAADGRKRCNKCHELKAPDEYPNAQSCPDGHAGTCKECRTLAAKQRRRSKRMTANAPAPEPSPKPADNISENIPASCRTPVITAAMPETAAKCCNKCGKSKQLGDYPVNSGCRDGHTGTCKECTRKRNNEHYHATKHRASAPAADPEIVEDDPDLEPTPEPDPAPVPKQDGNATRPYHCGRCGKNFHTLFVFQEHMAMRHPAL